MDGCSTALKIELNSCTVLPSISLPPLYVSWWCFIQAAALSATTLFVITWENRCVSQERVSLIVLESWQYSSKCYTHIHALLRKAAAEGILHLTPSDSSPCGLHLQRRKTALFTDFTFHSLQIKNLIAPNFVIYIYFLQQTLPCLN